MDGRGQDGHSSEVAGLRKVGGEDVSGRLPLGLPRARRVKRMHVIDAGQADGAPYIVRYRCHRCGATTGWLPVRNVSEGKRGIPCTYCEAVSYDRSI